MGFKLKSSFQPTGDQPQAIDQLVQGVDAQDEYQTLLGVTGSGKTFTMANVIERTGKPTLILSHNKTLVAQLYGEFKQFFPENAVEYFVSYYDYYQPEAYVPVADLYIEKDLSINAEVEKLRLSTTSTLLSGRRDVIVVASVSCIYGLGNPLEFKDRIIRVSKGESKSRNGLLYQLVDCLYSRTETTLERGNFRVKGDTVEIFLPYADTGVRLIFWGDEIEEIESFEVATGKRIQALENAAIFPANIYVPPKDMMGQIIIEIQDELKGQYDYFNDLGKHQEAKRLKERVEFDMEMMKELGYCSGIENYSRFFDRRNPGDRPFCLLDYFPDDYLMVIDESHVTLPQLRAMYGGDFSRKKNLVEYGFRLSSAMDNRPLKFEEYEQLTNQMVFVSATPGDYELAKSEGVVVEQVVRPTGLLDPIIEVRPSINQIDDLLDEIDFVIKKDQRVLVTTLTKRMAEEMAKYLANVSIKCRYIHSEVDTLERVEILRDLRLGVFDVLIGVNLLREGLDLPEVSRVMILDADKEGFLRDARSLTQIAGRAARNLDGKVVMYADKMTASMKKTIDETNRRREKQLKYNEENNITPKSILKSRQDVFGQTSVVDHQNSLYIHSEEELNLVADPIIQYMSKDQLDKTIDKTRKEMKKAAKDLDFLEAARLRDEMLILERLKLTKRE